MVLFKGEGIEEGAGAIHHSEEEGQVTNFRASGEEEVTMASRETTQVLEGQTEASMEEETIKMEIEMKNACHIRIGGEVANSRGLIMAPPIT